MKITACMIVRDEAQFLANSLAEARSWCDEMLVLDLGSRDGSTEIAVKYADVVIRKKPPFLVEHGFAFARNLIASHATGDWIYCVDADEMLSEEQRIPLRQFLEAGADGHTALNLEVFTFHKAALPSNDWVRIANSCRWDFGRHVRIYRVNEGYRWQGYIHEELFHPVQGRVVRAFDTAKATSFKHLHFTNYRTVSDDAKQLRFAKMLLRAHLEVELRHGMSDWWFENWYPSNLEWVREKAALYDQKQAEIDPKEFIPVGTPLPKFTTNQAKRAAAKKKRRRVY